MANNEKKMEEKPQLLNDFLAYMHTVKGKSDKTIHEYYLDLRTFFRFLKQYRGLDESCEFSEISIMDIDEAFIKSITLSDAYTFLLYTAQERPKHQNSDNSEIGLVASSRARKVSSIRSFFKYLTDKAHVIEVNPVQNLELPTIKRALPKYLTVDESIRLLEAVDGPFRERDYCILMLFLNCGLRVSELCGLNTTDIVSNQIRVLGKGNKERMLYLNDACIQAISEYLPHRLPTRPGESGAALFVSRNHNRIRKTTVEHLVKKYLTKAGLDAQKYSVHKLRHTAATMMYQNGVDIRTLQSVLGHDQVSTTQIYTHIHDANMLDAAHRNPLSSFRKKKEANESFAAPEENLDSKNEE